MDLKAGLTLSVQIASYLANVLDVFWDQTTAKSDKMLTYDNNVLAYLENLIDETDPDSQHHSFAKIPNFMVLTDNERNKGEKKLIIEEFKAWFEAQQNDPTGFWLPIKHQILEAVMSFPGSFGIVNQGFDTQTYVQIPYAALNMVGISLAGNNEGNFPVLIPGIIPFGRDLFGFSAVLNAIHMNSFLSTMDQYEGVAPPVKDVDGVNITMTSMPFSISKARKDQVLLSGSIMVYGIRPKSTGVMRLKMFVMATSSAVVSSKDQTLYRSSLFESEFDSLDEILLSLIESQHDAGDLGAMWLHYSAYANQSAFDDNANDNPEFPSLTTKLKSYAMATLKENPQQRPVSAPFMTRAIEPQKTPTTMSLFDF